MNNLVASLNYEYSPFGKELAVVAEYVLPLVAKAKIEKLKANEYDGLVRSLWVVNHVSTKKAKSNTARIQVIMAALAQAKATRAKATAVT